MKVVTPRRRGTSELSMAALVSANQQDNKGVDNFGVSENLFDLC